MAKSLEAALAETPDVQIPEEILNSTPEEINSRTKLIDNEMKWMKNEINRLNHEQAAFKEKIKENNEKIKLNKQLPYLVGNVVEVRITYFPFSFNL
jgi:26S proteasome regulatory subunit T5